MPTIDYYQAQTLAMHWGPRIVAAIAILVLAYLLAQAARWGLAKLIDRLPGIKQHNEGAPPKETAGYQLGQLGYWLVILAGIVGAMTVLELQEVVEPLNAFLVSVAAYVPRIVGAAVIFFVGLVIATVVRRVVEAALNVARVDAWLDKAGVSKMTGASGLARTVGTLVFVLILIPVTIVALDQLGMDPVTAPATAVLETVLSSLPRLLAAAIILAVAYAIGRWVASLIEQLLPSLGFDRSLQAFGIGGPSVLDDADPASEAPASAPRVTPSKVVARLALIGIMLFSAVEAARLLAFAAVAVMLTEVLELAGHVLFGGVIIVIGVLIANFLATLIDRSTNNAEGFASEIVRWATIALATAMGLRFMGIADEIVILAFGLILGAAAVAAAIAFGLGGRETAGRLLEKWTKEAETKRPPTPVRRPQVRPPPRTPRV
ncbi:mechanosensitive ion channel [Phenylobacterium sp.]|jgi:hypothetical protein|uniref:mechanosensitive ion channel n=1 Tax=Phenylobacterium sp. TaxID=1871053 RepID=UPI002F93FE50